MNFTINKPDCRPIVTFHQDGTVEFGDHLSPQEGSEEAWRLLKSQAAANNERISKLERALSPFAKAADILSAGGNPSFTNGDFYDAKKALEE